MSWQFIMLLVWTGVVACVAVLGIGFAGGVGEMFTSGNWLAWAVIASPVVPLALWLRERAGPPSGRG